MEATTICQDVLVWDIEYILDKELSAVAVQDNCFVGQSSFGLRIYTTNAA